MVSLLFDLVFLVSISSPFPPFPSLFLVLLVFFSVFGFFSVSRSALRRAARGPNACQAGGSRLEPVGVEGPSLQQRRDGEDGEPV